MKTLKVSPILEDEQVKKLEGEFLEEKHIKVLLNEDTIVYNEKDEPLAVFKKNCMAKRSKRKKGKKIKFKESPKELIIKGTTKKGINTGEITGKHYFYEWYKIKDLNIYLQKKGKKQNEI